MDKSSKNHQINIALVDDKAITDLNKQYFGKNNPTDIIAFNLNEHMPPHAYLLGELVISLAQVERQAKEYDVSVAEELARVTAHGVLHLLGYEDDTDNKKEAMKRIEDRIVAALHEGNT